MFISRKSRKLSRNNIVNDNEEGVGQVIHKEVEITSYPALEYMFGFALVGFSAYLLYSSSGGVNGIAGFRQKLWWQYIIAITPLLFGLSFILACQAETLVISRKSNLILLTKARFFCYVTKEVRKQFSDLMGISVIKSGKETKSLSVANYHIVLSFTTCEQIEALRCISESKILDYFQEVRTAFDDSEISNHKITIQNLLS